METEPTEKQVQELHKKHYNMCLFVRACILACGYVCGAPQRVAKLRAASSFGLPDGDLAALSLCALQLPNEDFRARQTNSNKLPCSD